MAPPRGRAFADLPHDQRRGRVEEREQEIKGERSVEIFRREIPAGPTSEEGERSEPGQWSGEFEGGIKPGQSDQAQGD